MPQTLSSEGATTLETGVQPYLGTSGRQYLGKEISGALRDMQAWRAILPCCSIIVAVDCNIAELSRPLPVRWCPMVSDMAGLWSRWHMGRLASGPTNQPIDAPAVGVSTIHDNPPLHCVSQLWPNTSKLKRPITTCKCCFLPILAMYWYLVITIT